MSAFVLKIIALAAMLIDHAGAAFPDYIPFGTRIIGRLTFPIFVYLLADGFRHTRNPKKFLLRLFAFALISEIPYDWAVTRITNVQQGLSPWHVSFLNNTNIFFTLLLGGLAIFAFQQIWDAFVMPSDTESHEKKPLTKDLAGQYAVVVAMTAATTLAIMWIADFFGADYGGYGVLFILLMYVVKPRWLKFAVFTVMNVFQHQWLRFVLQGYSFDTRYYLLVVATVLTLPLVALYNGKRGPSLKWLFYAAYPTHLAILAAIAWLVY